MYKNIVVCCDGTGNEFGGDCNSNVVKLYSTLIFDQTQQGYYHPGVGTMGSPTARSWMDKKWSQLKGLAFGAGLLPNVADAYRYLMDSYEPGDKVFLFGFSRGSYTARALAGVLHMYGLLSPGNDGLIPYVMRMYAKKSRKEAGRKETFETADDFKATFSRDCPVYFEGLWDTVSSVGWITNPVVLPFAARNPSMQIGRHAVSIHERRCYYRQNLWGAPFQGQNMKQVWFTGVHSDVGGSYPESQSGLSKITLQWMLQESESAGLKIDHKRASAVLNKRTSPDPGGEIHPSLKGAWWILEFLPHKYVDMSGELPVARWRIPFGAHRRIPRNSVIYELSKDHLDKWDDSFQVEPASSYPPERMSTSSGE